MSTTLTPPPLPPAPAPQPGPPAPQPSGPRASSRVVAILVIVFGGILILGAIISAVFSTVTSASVRTETRTAAVDGVRAIDIDVSAGSFRLEFAAVDEAELQVEGTWMTDRWTLERDGDTLRVASRDRMWGGPWLFGMREEATLRVPAELEGTDLAMRLAAGSFEADGTFGALSVDVGAGEARVRGAAETLLVDVSAGTATVELDDVRTADLSVSAGSIEAELSGEQPREVTADVSAGMLTLTVPDGEYDVTSDVSGGSFDSTLGSDPDARSTIDVRVSAGQADLRAG